MARDGVPPAAPPPGRQHRRRRSEPRARHRLPPIRHRAGTGRRRRVARCRARPRRRRLAAHRLEPGRRGRPSRRSRPRAAPGRRRRGARPRARRWRWTRGSSSSRPARPPSDRATGGPRPYRPWWGPLLGALADREQEREGRPEVRPSSFHDAGLRPAPDPGRRGAGDLVPLRRRSARVPLDRCARPRGRAVARGPARRGRHPRRSRARTATTESPSGGSYFRSTKAHNTVCIDGRDQSVSGGPVPVDAPRRDDGAARRDRCRGRSGLGGPARRLPEPARRRARPPARRTAVARAAHSHGGGPRH